MPDDLRRSGGATQPPGRKTAPVVLVIDDDAAIVHALSSLFESYGIEIATARDGREGLEALRRISPKVVITDVIMPEKDGIAVIAEMRRERPDLKIIAMSGGGRIGKSDLLTIAQQLGADSIVKKPFDAEEIVAAVRGHLARGS